MTKKTSKKSKKKLVEEGNAYIQASYNNTIVTLTEKNGDVLSWSSSGSNGFKGARKSTPYAAQVSAENAAEKAKVITVATSPFFIDQELAIKVFNDIFTEK